MKQRKTNKEMAKVDVSTIAKPKGIPDDWVVNPHNNPDIQYVKTSKTPLIRENWISPEALEKICPGCTHTRMTNAYYLKNKPTQTANQ